MTIGCCSLDAHRVQADVDALQELLGFITADGVSSGADGSLQVRQRDSDRR